VFEIARGERLEEQSEAARLKEVIYAELEIGRSSYWFWRQ
jgi:hypothetical protein